MIVHEVSDWQLARLPCYTQLLYPAIVSERSRRGALAVIIAFRKEWKMNQKSLHTAWLSRTDYVWVVQEPSSTSGHCGGHRSWHQFPVQNYLYWNLLLQLAHTDFYMSHSLPCFTMWCQFLPHESFRTGPHQPRGFMATRPSLKFPHKHQQIGRFIPLVGKEDPRFPR